MCNLNLFFRDPAGNSHMQEECQKVDKAVYHMMYIETVTDTFVTSMLIHNIHKLIELRQQRLGIWVCWPRCGLPKYTQQSCMLHLVVCLHCYIPFVLNKSKLMVSILACTPAVLQIPVPQLIWLCCRCRLHCRHMMSAYMHYGCSFIQTQSVHFSMESTQ